MNNNSRNDVPGGRPTIWEGIFTQFPSKPAINSFNSDNWIDSQRNECLKKLNSKEKEVFHEYPISIVATMVGHLLARKIRILDFGGGLGLSFLQLRQCSGDDGNIQFIIFENEQLCRVGNDLFKDIDEVSFIHEMPVDGPRFDIVHAGASLHYVEKWKDTIKSFSEFKPVAIVLSGLTAGDIPTFASYQHYYGNPIPVWFWNRNEIIEELKRNDFVLAFASEIATRYFGEIQPLPMENFPDEFRIRNKMNMVFINRKNFSICEKR